MRQRFVLLLVLTLGLVLRPQPSSQAAPASRLFPETGWRVAGRLLEFWEQSGGLAVFGLPLGPQHSEQVEDKVLSVQNFERARLEIHPDNAAPYDIVLGRLGADRLSGQHQDLPTETEQGILPEPCLDFAETAQRVCGPFLTYWRGHGLELGDAGISSREALALFGLPLTGARFETGASGSRLITQWFERARFEYHPANPAPYNVLLGRLGAELLGEPAPLPQPTVRVFPTTAIAQGHTSTIEVRSSEGLAVGGMLGPAPLNFVHQGERWIALASVGALQPPGRLPLRVEVGLPDGRTALATSEITVRDAGYLTERVDLPPAVQDSLARNGAALAEERARVNAIWPVATPDKLWEGRFVMPVEGEIVSGFGTKRSYNGGPVTSYHEGVDIKNSLGTAIHAPARGRVVLAEPNFVARGGAIIIDHGWGIHSGYWHMEEVLAHEGQFVEVGDLLGRMGSRGMSTAPHLHWEIHVGALSVDPLEWIERDWPAADSDSPGKESQ